MAPLPLPRTHLNPPRARVLGGRTQHKPTIPMVFIDCSIDISIMGITASAAAVYSVAVMKKVKWGGCRRMALHFTLLKTFLIPLHQFSYARTSSGSLLLPPSRCTREQTVLRCEWTGYSILSLPAWHCTEIAALLIIPRRR